MVASALRIAGDQRLGLSTSRTFHHLHSLNARRAPGLEIPYRLLLIQSKAATRDAGDPT